MADWRRTLWILWAADFLVMAGMSLVIPFLPLYIEQLGVHRLADLERWSSWVFSAQFITSFLFQPLWGALADRHGRKLMLLRAGFGMGVMTACMGLVGAPWQLLVLRFVNGVFSGFISMAVSLLASVTPEEHAGRALGTLQTGPIAGGLVGPLVGGALAEAISFRGVFFLTGASLLLACVIVMLFVHEQPKARQARERRRGDWRRLGPLVPVFVATLATQVGMMSIEPIVTVFAKTLYHGRHLAVVAGLVVAVTGMANLVGAPLLGRLGDGIGQRKVLVGALTGCAIAFLPQALARGIGQLLAGRFLLGLFVGGMIPSLNVLVKKMAPAGAEATAFGVNSSALFLGNLIGPLIGGSVAASFGIRSVFYVTMAVLAANALAIALNRRLQAPAHAA
ncbi:MAG: MFS transporter [Alicyclobacillaceae bacterium]|nr:MFS transporter [Alicyclobacillaceae bacterium]